MARSDLPTAKPTQLPSGAWVLRVVIGKQRLRLPVAGPNATPREVLEGHRAILRDWDRIVAAFEEERAKVAAEKSTADGPTFASVAKDWTSGALAKKYPDHVKKKRTAGDDAILVKKYMGSIAATPIASFKLSDAAGVMAGLPAHLSPASRRHVAQTLSRVLALAVFPLQLLPASPIPRGWLPLVPRASQRQQAMPTVAEHDGFLGCGAVPLVVRLFAGFIAREGMRHEEAEQLGWEDLDLENGLVRLDENKTDDPRGWALRPGTLRALSRWHKRCDKPKAGAVFVRDDGAPLRLRASTYRVLLTEAGGTRVELHEGSATTKPTGLHALRGLFVTERLAHGATERWISDRTGHRSSTMISTYQRRARSWSEARMAELRDLDQAIAWGTERGHADGHGGESGIRTRGTRKGAPDFESPQDEPSDVERPESGPCPHCGEPLSELNMATDAATLEAWSEALSFGVAGPCPGVLCHG